MGHLNDELGVFVAIVGLVLTYLGYRVNRKATHAQSLATAIEAQEKQREEAEEARQQNAALLSAEREGWTTLINQLNADRTRLNNELTAVRNEFSRASAELRRATEELETSNRQLKVANAEVESLRQSLAATHSGPLEADPA